MKAAILAVCLLLALSSCKAQSYQRVPMPPSDAAVAQSATRIFVLRLPSAKGFYRGVRVKDDEKEIGQLGGDSYLCWDRSAGASLLELTIERVDGLNDEDQLYVDAAGEAGQTSYYAITVDSAWGRPSVRVLPADEARAALAELKPSPVD